MFENAVADGSPEVWTWYKLSQGHWQTPCKLIRPEATIISNNWGLSNISSIFQLFQSFCCKETKPRGTDKYSLLILLASVWRNILTAEKLKLKKDVILLVSPRATALEMFLQHCTTASMEKKKKKFNVHNRTLLKVNLQKFYDCTEKMKRSSRCHWELLSEL